MMSICLWQNIEDSSIVPVLQYYFANMAYILQLSNLINIRYKSPKQKSIANQDEILQDFLDRANVTSTRGRGINNSITFIQEVRDRCWAIFEVSMKSHRGEVSICASFRTAIIPEVPLTNSMINHTAKAVKMVNQMTVKCLTNLCMHPQNGSFRIRQLVNTEILEQPQLKVSLFKASLSDTFKFVETFSGFLLYSSSQIPIANVNKHVPEKLMPILIGECGELKRIAEVKQIYFLKNYELSGRARNSKNKNWKQFFTSQGQSPQLLFRQFQNINKISEDLGRLYRNLPLYQSPKFLSGKLIDQGLQNQKLLTPPIKPSLQQTAVFNTITIIHQQRDKQKLINQGELIKVSIISIRYSFSKSRDVDEVVTEDSEPELTSGLFEKLMVMKLPQRRADQVKARKKLKWEKLILSNMRGATSNYLPKYYHTIQDHFPCKFGLLADLIIGYTLHEKMTLHRHFFSPFFVLSTGMHIANALIFLDGYKIAHLDLTPANILLDFENTIKIIDFGESYEQSVFKRNQASLDYYQYSPGVSFPYSSPQVLLRAKDFGFEQDIYSLGVILFQMLFSSTPLGCSFGQFINIYKGRVYHQRLMFVPEMSEDLGPIEAYNILVSLIFDMMRPEEYLRPHPAWVAAILKRLAIAYLK